MIFARWVTMPQKIILYIGKLPVFVFWFGVVFLGLISREVSAKPKSSIPDSLQVVRSIQRHRKTVSKAQKWADLIGVEIKTTDDPILQVYNNQDKKKTPRWLVVRVTGM